MSEDESTPPVPIETPAPELPSEPKRPSRLRRFFLLHLPLTVAGAVVLLAITAAGLFFWASSAGFENFVRGYLVNKVETATGGRVEIASFHWNLLHLEAEADGLVIHGLEASSEAPYAQVGQLRVKISILGIFTPRILLRELDIARPQLHLIVYADGSTNQPQPRKPGKPGKPALDRFFDLKTNRIDVEQGALHYENRAAGFDFQNRYIPLDFTARDASLRMAYAPATAHALEFYRIEAGVRDLNLARAGSSNAASAQPPVHGYLQATLELARNSADLRSLRITASGRGVKERTLEVVGSLDSFAHPRWQGRVTGDLDMRLVNTITGYPFTPYGIAHLDFGANGESEGFLLDGSIHVSNGSYIGTGVVATGVTLDAHLHGDAEQLLITSIVARLRQGGELDGEIALTPWLPFIPGTTTMQTTRMSTPHPGGAKAGGALTFSHPLPFIIPVNGKVTAQFKDVALDTLLEMVSDPPFQHLGFDTRINGQAAAHWINGDQNTVSVQALLGLTPPAQCKANETPASGLIDATYTEHDGAVDLRKLELNLPSSQLQAHGHLGAYPLTSSSALAVDFHSGNLREFDTVLRDLGLTRNGRSGTAALPVAISGQGDFQGSWTGSLVDPRLSGNAKAAQLAVELPPLAGSSAAQPQLIHLDSVSATGSYSGERITIEHGLLKRGSATIDLSGSRVAAATGSAVHGVAPIPSFDANSLLHLRLRASQVSLDDLRPFPGPKFPLAGPLNAQLQLDGPLRATSGSGWVELDKGSVYGEPVERIRAQGSIANRVLKLTSLTVNEAAGKIAATGSYELDSHRFVLNATGAGIDVARVDWLRSQGLAATGKLGFSVQGYGTPSDPSLEAHATLSGLALSGESVGNLALTAHTANRAVTYALTTEMNSAKLILHGQTALTGEYATQANLDFSHFNIGALFKLAHVQGISGESSLAGTVTVEGPLARPSDLRGEARLQELAATVAGVHLQSVGGAHATLDHALIHLDPLHVTGEETDLRAQGSLSLKDKKQLDFAASGTINLKVAETLDPDLTASGNTTFQVEAHGPLMNPGLRGRVDFQNGALSLEDVPNGLSQLHGTLEFNQNRLEVKSLTAMTGGGQLSLSGYLAYQHGLFANLTATGTGIRIRYPSGVSSLADATLHLQGQQNDLLLSGDVLITRFALSPELDISALAQQASAVGTIAPADAPSNHLRLDVHLTSSPQLSFQNGYAKLAGNVDLRLRGTLASPSLLGSINVTEGSGIIAGTRYELQRGDINFTNPVHIEPIIDLNATARVEDYDINLGLHGTPAKLAVIYRSDPPLPEADVLALLALGRTESQQRIYTQQQQQSGANPTDALLGGALNATVSSRVQKLFGAGSVKVDPNYLGALGNSTSRIIVEEQLGRTLTLTYATNVNTTGQQLIQAEVAINHHVSLQLARDESGVFSVVLKATRRYR